MLWIGKTFFVNFQRFSIISEKYLFNKVPRNLRMPFYAVARGRTVGIYNTWGECETQVKGFPGARYKKFESTQLAQDFINSQSGNATARSNYKSQHNGPSKPIQNNLKRSYSTSTTSNNCNNNTAESDDSADAEELDDLMKQLDDIERRVNRVCKGNEKTSGKNMTKTSGRKAILIEAPQPKKHRSNDQDFLEDSEGFIQVYTDGACSDNGKQNARAGLGVYWGDGHPLNTSEPVSGRATNNCGEIQAATCAIRQALQNGINKLAINTDSKFLINSVTKWLPGWKRKGWKLKSGEPVKNERDFKELDSIQHKLQIKWHYVEAHKGIHGNEMADQLARAGAAMYNK